jgi:hypothetical protein
MQASIWMSAVRPEVLVYRAFLTWALKVKPLYALDMINELTLRWIAD